MAKRSIVTALCLWGCATPTLNGDASFDRWCGDALCDWTTEEGQISRISTWHRNDYGVSLDQKGTRIAQQIEHGLLACTSVTLVADVAPEARVVLEIDVGADGESDFTQQVVGEHYTRLTFQVSLPYRGPTRFVFHKDGEGRARLAGFEVRSDPACDTRSPALLAGGAACTEASECLSDTCREGVCASCPGGVCLAGEACALDADCATGVCGQDVLVSSEIGGLAAARCVACRGDADCPDARCTFGVCSACDDAACTAGACRSPSAVEIAPFACVLPPAEPRARGELCRDADECADGLACAAPDGAAPRCGAACLTSLDCGPEEACAAFDRQRGVLTRDGASFALVLDHWLEPLPSAGAGLAAFTCLGAAELAALYGQ